MNLRYELSQFCFISLFRNLIKSTDSEYFVDYDDISSTHSSLDSELEDTELLKLIEELGDD